MKIDLSGRWSFDLDPEMTGVEKGNFNLPLWDQISLPGTVSSNQLGEASDTKEIGHLTDPYAFTGYAWFTKYINFDQYETHEYYLILERTRNAHIWIDDTYVDSRDTLVAPHEYFLSPHITKKKHRVTILVDNSSYRIKGGHLTSPDTQTNWNGIVGEIYLDVRTPDQLHRVTLDASYLERRLDLSLVLQSNSSKSVTTRILDGDQVLFNDSLDLRVGSNRIRIDLPEEIEAWSEHHPKLYTISLDLNGEIYEYNFGVRDFKAVGRHFEINGERTFLRGKHDGLIFPLTAYAPMDVESWLKVMSVAKDHGINHYRFHTACPPDAAFTAADMLGIYMEPELPFWGTVTTEADEEHDGAAEAFLISEGFRMLDAYGNHPSFVMMSMGNELWGSKERIDEMLAMYRSYDPRPLYTQGSNNFQFSPTVLPHEDFFTGVRFSQDRLIRGSYAMCDAPQGHIQTAAPNSSHNYDEFIVPKRIENNSNVSGTEEIVIQYETGTKTVTREAGDAFIPEVPVVSHEIGQYGMYPNYDEIEKYTGVLKARNLEVFRERLEAKGMLHLADRFFRASGRLAVDAYKAELEAAIGSHELAGYQILDIQDFSGQGTALVGILDAFMDSKGLITPEAWREFCSDHVLMAALDRFVFRSGESIDMPMKLAHYGAVQLSKPILIARLFDGETEVFKSKLQFDAELKGDLYNCGSIQLELPVVDLPKKLDLVVEVDGRPIRNRYKLWVYPPVTPSSANEVVETADFATAQAALERGDSVLFYPTLSEEQSIEGTYCTDFWNYPMFRQISENMNRTIPIGTHGLTIQNDHPIFAEFPTEDYTTAQWYDIISNSRVQILDESSIWPIAQMIDNVERNHRLGLIWEARVGEAQLVVVTAALDRLAETSLPAASLRESILKYMNGNQMTAEQSIDLEAFKQLFS